MQALEESMEESGRSEVIAKAGDAKVESATDSMAGRAKSLTNFITGYILKGVRLMAGAY